MKQFFYIRTTALNSTTIFSSYQFSVVNSQNAEYKYSQAMMIYNEKFMTHRLHANMTTST